MSSTSNDTKSVAIYCRISSAAKQESGERSTENIESQERRCRDFAKSQGWQVHEVYSDNSISGGESKRPGYLRLQADIAAQKFDVVLATFFDRFTREDLEYQLKFRREAKEAGVEVWTIDKGYYDPEDESMNMLAVFEGMFAAKYREDVRKKQIAKKRDLLTQGVVLPGKHRLFGYIDKYKTAIDPIEAAHVRKAFHMVAAGNSNFAVVNYLNNNNVKSTAGTRWRTRDVRHMISNHKYVGWNVSSTGEILTKQGNWTPIVDTALFDKANKRIAKRKKYEGKGSPSRLLSGLLYCAGTHKDGEPCLTKFVVATDGTKSKRYRCQPGFGCGTSGIKAEWAEQFVIENVIKPLLETLPERQAQAPDYSAELEQIDGQLERLTEMYQWEDISRDKYVTERADLKAKKAALLEKSASSTANLGSFERFLNSSVDAQREMVRQLVPNGFGIKPGVAMRKYDTQKIGARFVYSL